MNIKSVAKKVVTVVFSRKTALIISVALAAITLVQAYNKLKNDH